MRLGSTSSQLPKLPNDRFELKKTTSCPWVGLYTVFHLLLTANKLEKMRSLLQKGSKVVPQRLKTTATASTAPKMMKATVEAYSEGPTTLVRHIAFKFIIDEPPKLGGKGLGPNPLTHLLGSLAACTSYTMEMVAKEMKIAKINRASWSATGSYDLRGLQGVGETDARFQSIELKGLVDTDASEEDLHKIQEQVEKRCIVAATLGASGMKMNLVLEKGTVEHDCKPACELHDLEKEKGATGEYQLEQGSRHPSSSLLHHYNLLLMKMSFFPIFLLLFCGLFRFPD